MAHREMTVAPQLFQDFLKYAAAPGVLENLDAKVPWVTHTAARSECFMALDVSHTYSYGRNEHVRRTYHAAPMPTEVRSILDVLNAHFGTQYNVCMLNRYGDQRQALGWHSDDSPEQDQLHPIAVVSFGAAREIWTRPIGSSGVVDAEARYLLLPGSLFVMPGGFQQTHQHRIPKHGSTCGLRISLTFRYLKR